MTSAVKTTQVIDPRIEPQPDPVYQYVIGPTQNQFYHIPASSTSNSFISFNNLTTLGVDRAYLDTFEIELSTKITFHTNKNAITATGTDATKFNNVKKRLLIPKPDEWTFDSFPFNKCVDSARVNINGGTFFSEPLSYLRAKERYMDQRALSKCYENVCPTHRAFGQTESGMVYNQIYTPTDALALNYHTSTSPAIPTRYGKGVFNSLLSEEGMAGGFNNDFIQVTDVTMNDTTGDTIYQVKWREPVMVSPFSSRYDATFGRPLYNITSLDLAFNLQNLGNMIRLANYRHLKSDAVALADNDEIHGVTAIEELLCVMSYDVEITHAELYYQVETLPSNLVKPMTTLVPYRRYVPYITKVDQTPAWNGIIGAPQTVSSGVYTLNEIPTAIWLFVAPSKSEYQENNTSYPSPITSETTSVTTKTSWDTNKLFAYIKHVSIDMANTTQLLNTCAVHDLYRIAKANGCEDSFLSWSGSNTQAPYYPVKSSVYNTDLTSAEIPKTQWYGAGSVLRLVPGVDLVVPDQALIPGANANNMVFKANVTYEYPPGLNYKEWSLWILFEYVGVGAISPGQCEITMNPLGSGEIMAASPIVSATNENTEGTLGGAGFWDKVKKFLGIAHHVAKDNQLVSKLLRIAADSGALGERGSNIAGKASEIVNKVGYGAPACKRTRGGAVMGLGDWT